MDNRSFVSLVLAVLGLRCCMAFFLVMENGILIRAFLVAQRLKRLPTMRETWVRSLGLERSPGEGNGNPLQYSCLENPMDGEVHEVAKSRT